MPRPRSAGPTQATIASVTGVSVPTVSKALRNDPTISERTRASVLAAARDIGYLQGPREATGDGPGATRSVNVSVLFDTVDNTYSAEVLQGMLCAARVLDQALRIDQIGIASDRLGRGAQDVTVRLARRLAEGAAALVLVTTPVTRGILDLCAERRLPVIAIDPATRPPAGILSLSATNWRGGVQATEHLLQLGHRRIGVICGPKGSVPAIERLAGFRSAMGAAQADIDPGLIRSGRFDFDTGLVQAARLLRADRPPTAVFAMNDAIAAGVIEAARRRQVRIPQDLSVVGFDDTLIAALSSPQLTTVRQPLQEIGAEALHLAARMLRDEHVHGGAVEMQTSLILRDSTAPPTGSAPGQRR